MAFSRADTSVLGRWWWTVDRWTLAALGVLIGVGAIMILAASPPVAARIGLGEFYFIQRHLVMLVPALDGNGVDIVMIRTSTMTQADMRDLLAYIDAWCAEQPAMQEVPA